MKITCCYQCDKRNVTCHIDCKDYLEERDRLDKINEQKCIERQVRSTLTINSFNQHISSSRGQRKLFRFSCK
jgi:hypothetical protein